MLCSGDMAYLLAMMILTTILTQLLEITYNALHAPNSTVVDVLKSLMHVTLINASFALASYIMLSLIDSLVFE